MLVQPRMAAPSFLILGARLLPPSCSVYFFRPLHLVLIPSPLRLGKSLISSLPEVWIRLFPFSLLRQGKALCAGFVPVCLFLIVIKYRQHEI